MKRYFKLILSVICVMFVILTSQTVYAADATVSVSSGTVEEGSNVEVSVTIAYGSEPENAYQIQLNYDREILEFVQGEASGTDGVLYMSSYASASASETIKLTFKAKNAGTSALTIADGAIVSDRNEVLPDNIVITNGSITVTAKVTSSSNNFLSKLEVQGVREDGSTQAYNITQRETNIVGFDKNQTKYMGYVANDIVKFAVTAIPEDNTATVNITGVDLAEGGANVTTITVTAQNGEVRTYVINTYRVPSEGDVEPETPAEPETPSEPESETTSTPATPVDKEVTIGNDIYIVSNIAEETLLPEGFSRFDYTYDGQSYVAAKGEAKKLTIMQLVKKGTDERSLYVYDEANNVFYKFVNIQIINKMYTITEKPENVVIPADFEATLVNIEGEMLNVWANKNEEGIYMFYGMNWNGEQGLYLYDSKEKTAMRYLALTSSEVSNTVTPEPNTDSNATTNNGNATEGAELSKKNIIIFAEAGVIVVLIIVIIILIIKAKNPDFDEDEEDEEDEDDDEKKSDDILSDEELAEMDADAEEDEAYEKEEQESMLEEMPVSESVILANAVEEMMEEEAAKEEVKEEFETTAEPSNMYETVEMVVEEENIEETVVEEAVESTVDNSDISIEDMLSDSSTSLNDDELDMVLDKLLSDE